MDPTQKPRLVAALKRKISELSPQLGRAAKYVIDHPSDFGLNSIRDTARKARVSTYTLVKLSKTMGFSGFDEFRAPFRQALVSSSHAAADSAWINDNRQQGPLGTIYADALSNAMATVSKSLENQDLEKMRAVTQSLMEARKVYLTAARSSYALAYYVHYVGRMALPTLDLIPRHRNSAIDDLNDAGPGDMLIAITTTPYSRETVEACEFARNKGVGLVLVTDSDVISPEMIPDHTLVCSVQSTHSFGCYAGMTAVLETLLAMLMHQGGAQARERIGSYEDLRTRTSAYWPAKKNFR